jgi:hypothetical protein
MRHRMGSRVRRAVARRVSWWLWLLAILGWVYLPHSVSWLGLWLLAVLFALAAYGSAWGRPAARQAATALPLVLAALSILLVVLLPVRLSTHTEAGDGGLVGVASRPATPGCRSVYSTGQVGALLGSDTHLNVELCTDGRTVRQEWGPDCYGNTAFAAVDAHPEVRHGAGGVLSVACRLEVSPATLPFVHRSVAMEVMMAPDGSVRLTP